MDYFGSLSIATLILPVIVFIILIWVIFNSTKRRGGVWGNGPKNFTSDGSIEIRTGETFILGGKLSFLSQRMSYSGMINENTFSISVFIWAGRGGLTTYPVYFPKDSREINIGNETYRVLNVDKDKLQLQKI